ncbi:hypothetical protein NDU88_003311 [Pleurodeles waltl]|uniref:Uncharacterized protein n=1 Tax=Pleurodeles waltl TaxID=8319 RepID=A0AAV7T5F4_PLEWA|nr:hypothetical protein NDU88_003311 [Pleurodeles waltl]
MLLPIQPPPPAAGSHRRASIIGSACKRHWSAFSPGGPTANRPCISQPSQASHPRGRSSRQRQGSSLHHRRRQHLCLHCAARPAGREIGHPEEEMCHRGPRPSRASPSAGHLAGRQAPPEYYI